MKGILLINLGSPDSTSIPDVKRYLDEFLMDKRVIDYNIVKRNLLIRGVILRKRPPRTAEAYNKIWWPEGSPLIVISERVQKKLQAIVDIPVALAMRYASPSIETGLEELVSQGITEISVVPLYPQYAMSSTETVVARTMKVTAEKFPQVNLHFVKPFYDDEDYLRVLSEQMKRHLPAEFDKLIFSFHGIPERHFFKYGHEGVTDLTTCAHSTDPVHNSYCYLYQASKTVQLVSERLGLSSDQVMLTYQSRLGREKWVEPYTDEALETLPSQGVKKIAIVCPAFVSDCLETLEEIQMEGAEEFKEAGGEEYTYIPCLNDDDEWIKVLKKLSLQAFDQKYEVPLMITKL